MKLKVTLTAVREYEYTAGEEGWTHDEIREAALEDPFEFLDNDKTEVEVKVEDL